MKPDPASLTNLRDLALPPPVAWWPPQVGWWILAVGLLLVTFVLLARALRVYRSNGYRRAALAELGALPNGAVTELSALLKCTALAVYPRPKVARLTGTAWWDFLNATGGDFDRFGGILEHGEGVSNPTEWPALLDAARHWISHHHGETSRP